MVRGVYDLKGESNTHCYKRWRSLMDRLNNGSKGSTCCDEWLVYSNFKKWYYEQEHCDKPGYELDKDLLGKGNKHYSPEYCELLPQRLNAALVGLNSKGVYKDKVYDRYSARIKIKNKDHSLYFDNEQEAVMTRGKMVSLKCAYLAIEFKKDISKKAYEALMNY